MLNLKTRFKRSLRTQTNKLICVGNDVKTHRSWRGCISLTDGAKLLEGASPFTYILTQGFDKHHYVLSYVGSDYVVKHRNVRAFLRDGIRMYKNGGSGGGGGGYETIDNLVPSCLNCSASICCPL